MILQEDGDRMIAVLLRNLPGYRNDLRYPVDAQLRKDFVFALMHPTLLQFLPISPAGRHILAALREESLAKMRGQLLTWEDEDIKELEAIVFQQKLARPREGTIKQIRNAWWNYLQHEFRESAGIGAAWDFESAVAEVAKEYKKHHPVIAERRIRMILDVRIPKKASAAYFGIGLANPDRVPVPMRDRPVTKPKSYGVDFWENTNKDLSGLATIGRISRWLNLVGVNAFDPIEVKNALPVPPSLRPYLGPKGGNQSAQQEGPPRKSRGVHPAGNRPRTRGGVR